MAMNAVLPGPLLLLSVAAAAAPSAPPNGSDPVEPDAAPALVAIQTDLFAEAGSLSNAWADFDRDGDLDFAVSVKSGAIRLYRNDSGHFVSIGAELGLPVAGPEFRGLSWGDYDGDGWLDLFAGATSAEAESALFRSEEGRHFTDVAGDLGLTLPGRSSRQNNWIDFDGDGDLDLYATDRIGPNRLLRNDGDGFTQIMADQPLSQFKSTVGACWLDYDRDGDLDLFLANQSGQTDSLLRNDRTGFTDVAPALGMDRPDRPGTEGSVGCAIGDYDNDGHLDIFVPSYGRNVLWHNAGDGSFTDRAAETGVDVENHAVGASWGDYDNDGFVDLFVTSYHGERGSQVPADALFRNRGGTGFADMIAAAAEANRGDHGVEWVDYDGDGAIDLSMTHGYTDTGGHFVLRNALARGDAARSLQVLVRGEAGRQAMPGTEVRLYDEAGDVLATRQVSTGGGYNAQSVRPLHFGLAEDAPVIVEVTYVTGTARMTQRLEAVDPKQWAGTVLVVEAPAGPAD